jgi:GTP pyrophosphokinase
VYNPFNIDQVMNYYKLNSHLDLLYRIATKNIDLKELKLFQVIGDKIEAPKPIIVPVEHAHEQHAQKQIPKKDSELIIFGASSDQIKYALAKCCNPIPGDDVFGFVSTGKGLMIHRTTCPNATQLLANYSHRVVKTKWAKNKEISFLTGLSIIGMDDVGIINKITNVISGELKINIAALTIESKEGLFEGTIKVFVHDKDELELLVDRIKSLHGIQQVNRFDTDTV